MPNRYLRASFIESEAINSVSRDAELFWLHLLVHVDDFGRCEGNPELLRARLFPLRLETIRKVSVSGWLVECESAQLIRRYVIDEKQYIQVMKWEQGRAEKSKYPAMPDGYKHTQTDANICLQPLTEESEGLRLLTAAPDPDPDPDPDRSQCSSAKPHRTKPKSAESIDFVEQLKRSPAYAGIDIDRELAKIDIWLQTPKGRGRKKTHQMVVNWLNKIDPGIGKTKSSKELYYPAPAEVTL